MDLPQKSWRSENIFQEKYFIRKLPKISVQEGSIESEATFMFFFL